MNRNETGITKQGYCADMLWLIAGALVVCLWSVFVLYRFVPPRVYDWPQYLFTYELQRLTIAAHHQFPLWTPYVSGGQPFFANPLSCFLSPLYFFVLLFGTVRGIFWMIVSHVAIGTVGMYLLTGQYTEKKEICFLNAVFFLHHFNVVTYVGAMSGLFFSLYPWIYLFWKRVLAGGEKRYAALISVLLALMVYSGAVYACLMLCMLLGFETVFLGFRDKSVHVVRSFLRICALFLILSAAKFLPMVQLLAHYTNEKALLVFPFRWDVVDCLQLAYAQLKHFLLSGALYQEMMFGNEEMIGYNISAVGVGLIVCGIGVLWKRHRLLVITMLFFVLYALGSNSLLVVHSLVSFCLPIFQKCDLGSKMFFLPLFLASLTVGLTMDALRERLLVLVNGRIVYRVLFVCVLAAVLLSVLHNAGVLRKKWDERPPLRVGEENIDAPFSQVRASDANYFALLQDNYGVVNAHDSFGDQHASAVLDRDRAEYKGEYYLAGASGSVRQTFFSPNVLSYALVLDTDDVLVVNQNYFSGWKADAGDVCNYNGLIGVRVKKGVSAVRLYYVPHAVWWGVVIMIVGGAWYMLPTGRSTKV